MPKDSYVKRLTALRVTRAALQHRPLLTAMPEPTHSLEELILSREEIETVISANLSMAPDDRGTGSMPMKPIGSYTQSYRLDTLTIDVSIYRYPHAMSATNAANMLIDHLLKLSDDDLAEINLAAPAPTNARAILGIFDEDASEKIGIFALLTQGEYAVEILCSDFFGNFVNATSNVDALLGAASEKLKGYGIY